ncbi:hypothetical protein DOTSEDRAFT_174493 [Lecanosticta acicola]|uniref:Rhodopsin domain-containing protein n=1 Tax=Lecanosticta acicola TaxID=111012 RepID=A0AAI8Z1Z8_9PEZI|nr:hypothetical protein DOTSEDRAFT_174493 [Lecanosticta acicola]
MAVLSLARRSFREDVDDAMALNSPPPVTVHLGAGDVGWRALGPAIAFGVLATTVVALRWYTRCNLVRNIGLDDWVILLSLVGIRNCLLLDANAKLAHQALSWTMCGLIGAEVHMGIGNYSTANGAVDTIMVAKLIVTCNSIWAVTVSITKASILTQYLRVFNGRTTRMCCWLLLFCLLPTTCWGVFGGVFLCKPAAKLWNVQLPGHCRDAQTYWVSVGAVNIGLDFFTLLLPLPAIAGLHLPRRQKLATLLVFLLGFVVCAVSVSRLTTVLVAAEQGDYIMSGIWSIIWSVIEANVGIICASLLALKAFVVKMFPTLMEECEVPGHQMRIAKIPSISNEEVETTSERLSMPPMGCTGQVMSPPSAGSEVLSDARNDTTIGLEQMLGLERLQWKVEQRGQGT